MGEISDISLQLTRYTFSFTGKLISLGKRIGKNQMIKSLIKIILLAREIVALLNERYIFKEDEIRIVEGGEE
tara:strand:- start:1959 stop:2174 length:216 start_codon:yes stop_codon:yes gene_type:complete